jgi:hypothetical protein
MSERRRWRRRSSLQGCEGKAGHRVPPVYLLLMAWASILLFWWQLFRIGCAQSGVRVDVSKTLDHAEFQYYFARAYAPSNPHSRVQIDLRAQRSDPVQYADQIAPSAVDPASAHATY